MRGVLVMTMVTISPSGREISPIGSSCRSSRLDLLNFRLVAAVKPRKCSSLIFSGTKPSYSKKGGAVGRQGAHKPCSRHQGGGGFQACWALVAPLWYFFRPIFFIYSQNIPRRFSGQLELCRIEDSDLLLFQSRIPAA